MIGVGFFFGNSNFYSNQVGGNPGGGGGVEPGGDTNYNYNNPEPASYSTPIVITSGGEYTFNRESTDSNTPTVYIDTTQKVTLVNCNLKGAGYLINNNPSKPIDIEVINCRGYGIDYTTPNSGYLIPRRFLSVDNYKNIIVENCYMENTAGIIIAVEFTGDNTNGIRIRANQAKNITGFCKNSSGDDVLDAVQFLQILGYSDDNGTREVPNVDIGYNFIYNQPNLSSVEDNMNFYNFRGTASSPVMIHNNYIKGAYPYPWNADIYSGGGIMIESPGSTLGWESSNFILHDNFMIMSDNYTFAVAAGTNVSLDRNYGVCKGYIDNEDAARLGVSGNDIELKGYPSGHYGYDYYGTNVTDNISFNNMTSGIVGENSLSTNDPWRNDGESQNRSTDAGEVIVTETNRTDLANPITRAIENSMRVIWNGLVSGMYIGVNGVLL